ncbi:hypothetical protein ACHAWF_000105, partial [Thalassiosira exigua]
ADAAALFSSSSSDICDRVAVLRAQESSIAYRPLDYLARLPAEIALADIEDYKLSRSKMCLWSHRLADACNLSRHAVVRAMNYLDRYVASKDASIIFDKRRYQLAAMTALSLSVKLHEPLALDAALLAEISAGCYDAREIIRTERAMIEALQWKLSDPTSLDFACCLVGLIDPSAFFGCDLVLVARFFDAVKIQCELASMEYDVNRKCKPSEVALASI